MKHSVSWITATVLGCICLSSTAIAQSDFYIRSQFSNGKFTGFHEILTKPKAGYYQARYCDRTFWVSSGTVLWTEEQSEAGNSLVLEEVTGQTRTVVCSDKTAFATLEELGLSEREIAKLRAENAPLNMRSSRLRTIRDAFKQFK